MQYLIFMDNVQNYKWVIALASIFALAGSLVYKNPPLSGWTKNLLRLTSWIVAAFSGGVLFLLVVGSFIFGVEPWEHTAITSKTGKKVALLSHGSFRDSSATRVTIKEGCCTRYLAYDYYGDGDDYISAASTKWIDDRHLLIRYSFDPTGVQSCLPRAGGIEVICELKPEPTFPNMQGK